MAEVIWIVCLTLVTSAFPVHWLHNQLVNGADPDETAPAGAVSSGSSLFTGNMGLTILNKHVPWKEANESCTLATPKIASHASLTVDIGSTQLEKDVNYWTGYTLVNKLFVYEGCSIDTDVANHSVGNSSIFQPDPGLGYSACGTNAFGVKGSRCYSFESFPPVRSWTTKCDSSCIHPNNQIKCGGNKFVSMFKVSTVPLENITRGKFGDSCVAFDLRSRSLVLENCVKELPAMCRITTNRNSSVEITSEKYTWSASYNYCYFKYRYPLREPVDTDQSDGLVWTGMFLSKTVIRKFREHVEANQYGYIVQRNGTTSLKFEQQNRTFKALCADQMLTTVNTFSNNPVTLISTPFATEENVHQDKAKETAKVVLYISIPGIALLTVISAFICCKKRAKAKHSIHNATVSMDYSQVQDSIDNGYVYSAPFDTLGNTRQSNPKDDDDGAYDVTNAGGTARNKFTEGENVYKKLNMLSDDDYDYTNLKISIGSGKSGQRTRHLDDGIYSIASNNTGNTYDTSAVKGGQRVLENEYSTGNCDEAYSNTTIVTRNKSSETDNIYE